jgi:transcriptional regulator GlxA family with amidase domain
MIRVGIFVFPDVEILDFAGPYEVFSVANRLASAGEADCGEANRRFEVFLVAETKVPVTTRYGMKVDPHFDFSTHPSVDLLVVPGGPIDAVRRNRAALEWLGRTAVATTITASICTGAFLLAEAGLLDELRATTHWEDAADLRQQFPKVAVVDDAVWVDEGRIVTSGGIAAGMDMCLHLVERLYGRELARRVARQIVYEWRDGSPSGGGLPRPAARVHDVGRSA